MNGSAPEPLSVDDAQILRLESAAIKGHTGKLLVLAPGADGASLDPAALRDRVGERIASFPRLRQRVELPGHGQPSWVEAALDLGWHVAEAGARHAARRGGLPRSPPARSSPERLDHERPLWRLDVLPLEGGRTGIVGRIHHAMADGVTAIRIAAGLLWDQPENEGGGDLRARPQAEARGDQAAAERAPLPPEHRERPLLVRLPGRFAASSAPARDTVLDRHIGSEREVAWTVVPLERLKAIGQAAGEGITVNDVVLAVVAGGLRQLARGRGVAARQTSAPRSRSACTCARAVPRSATATRSSTSTFPLSEPDPVERLRAINAETSEAKLDHDADTLYSFFHALGRFRPLYDGVTRIISGPREFALSVSNVPGPRERPLILGHEVREFCSFAEPADRHALRVAVISLGGDLAFGLCSDPEAIGELDHLAEALEASVAELESES